MFDFFSIAECLQLATELQQVSDTPRLDVEVFLCEAMDVSKTFLYTWPEKKLDVDQYKRFTLFLSKRKAGEPVAYIVGRKEFWSREFFVNSSTLIPRPDTESLIEYVLRFYAGVESEFDILDLGTGTGALGITLALELENTRVDAVDFSEEAIRLAIKNAKQLGACNTNIFQSDWFSRIPKKAYRLIVSNPPYIDKDDEHLSCGDVRFEPSSALVAKEKGLGDIQLITRMSKQYLQEKGQLVIEHGFDQAKLVREIFESNEYLNVDSHLDLSGQERFTVGFI